MDNLDYDVIYNIEKLENSYNSDNNINYNNKLSDNLCKHNYIYDNKIGYVCTICGEVNNEIDTFIDKLDTEQNNYKPIDQIDSIRVKGIKNYKLNQKATRIYSNIDYEKKELLKIMNDIYKFCMNLNITKNIADDAQLIYQNVIKAIINDDTNKFIKVRGNNNDGLIGACIYYACLKNNLCITISKIAKIINNLKQKYIHTECSMIIKLMKKHNELNKFIPITCFYYPIDYLNTMIKCFNISKKKDIFNIKKMLIFIQYNELIPNHNPLSIAIAVSLIYLVYKGYILPNFAKKDIAKYFEISQPTVSSAYKELNAKKSIILNYCLNHNEIDIINEFDKTNKVLNNDIIIKLKNKYLNLNKNIIVIDLDFIRTIV